ncbi:MAG: acyl-ACP--UDP-N-acetylglucosamine O-acyltransferase [Candidatus Omnitrophica bacterium]|nr:acyl-ACP--UDP-N-acetylglucosamine O-acyltransferase [Candidatus Omnitrophota bacterium]
MPAIHPTAEVDSKAELSADVSVGPYAVIGPHVKIGSGTTVGPHAVIDGHTTLGERCEIFASAVIGARTQDLKFKGKRSFLNIGSRNIFREFVTVSCATEEDAATRIGNDNFFMAYAHVAHDCVIGSGCIMANNGTLGGHVILEDRVIIGGLAAVHQFVRVGKLAIVGGCSKVVQDVLPFSMSDGHPARVYGLNWIGLRRAGISADARRLLQRAFRILMTQRLTKPNAIRRLEALTGGSAEIEHLIRFLKQSKRGIGRANRSSQSSQASQV